MAMKSEILLSTRELGCRRTNQQSQRYLGCVIKQLDMEKKMVKQDWDHRMKTFISQKKKSMPDGWDPGKLRRPRSAWNEQQKHKFYVVSRPESGNSAVPFASRIPDHWNLCASYKILPSGERIPQPIPGEEGDNPAHKKKHHHIHPCSARPGSTRMIRNVKPRRVVSAPARRTGLSTCLVTLNGGDREKLDQLIESNLDRKANDDDHDDDDDVTANSCNSKDGVLEKDSLLNSKPPSGYPVKKRPISAVVKHNNSNSDRDFVNSRPKSGLSIRDRPVSAVTNSNNRYQQQQSSSCSLVNNKNTRGQLSSKHSLSSGSLSSIDDSAGSYTLLR